MLNRVVFYFCACMAVSNLEDMPFAPVASITLHAAQQICTALNNNIVSQFSRAVVALLRVSAADAGLGAGNTAAALKTAVAAVATHLLDSQIKYDAWVLPVAGSLSGQLWSLVQPQAWCRALRGVAVSVHGYKTDLPVTYLVKCDPQAYLGVRMELATLVQAQADTAKALRIKPLQLFPLSKSNIPDFCRIDYFGMRDVLVRHLPDVLPRTGPDKACRDTGAAVPSRIAAVVWNAAFKTSTRPFRPAKAHGRWSVFGKSVQTDGVALKVQRLFVDAKPEERIVVSPIPASQYDTVNHGGTAVRQTKAQAAVTIATNRAALVENPPPPPSSFRGRRGGPRGLGGYAWTQRVPRCKACHGLALTRKRVSVRS